ncbi:DMT family transporter [Sporosarcina sp. PTS2304]|uniref:DMT family transporter n=1 Tax=Sporosarcina sp. PTS2304 TaxID=2283194 RepID=UPI000E0D13FE|nr:DMT family transporter [Sporosarcina sp. PTS2304]AXH99974.1 DMT family transporter [Sporosarcina sp. PTS2304]
MNKKALYLGLFTVVAWGSSFAAIRVSLLGGYSPGHLVLTRFAVASLVFILYALWPGTKIRFPAWRDMWKILLLGWTGISVYHFGLTYGEQTVAAGTAGLFIATVPIFTTIIAIIFLKERVSILGWIGMAIGLAGVALITIGSSEGALEVSVGAWFIIVAVIATSFFFVFQKPLFKKYTPIELTAYFTWAGTLPFLYFTPGIINEIQGATMEATLATIYMGIIPATIAYVTWSTALSIADAGAVSSLLYIEPVVAIVVAWVWLQELPSVLSTVGGIIAIVSVIAVNWETMRRRPALR